MFTARSNYQRRRTALRQNGQRAGRKFRPLAIEPMEGRLMLSTTWLEFAPLDLRPAPLTLESENQSVIVSPLNPGGFISSPSPGASDNDGMTLAGTLNINSSESQSHTRALNITTSLADTWLLFGSSGTIGSAVIRAEYEVILNADAEPIADLTASEMDPQEGGAIPIEFILASAGSGKRIQPPGHVKTALASAKLGEGSNSIARPAASMPPRDTSLSGEWARAVVFEMAGGEPETGGRSVESEETDAHTALEGRLRRLVPASGGQVPGISRTATDLADDHIEEPSAKGRITQLVLDQRNRDAADGSAGSAALELISHSARLDAPAATPMADDGIAQSAIEAAFEQLNESTKTGILFLGTYSRRAVEATPLLLLLALERVAARNSRRCGRNTETSPCAPCRRRGIDGNPLPQAN